MSFGQASLIWGGEGTSAALVLPGTAETGAGEEAEGLPEALGDDREIGVGVLFWGA